MLLCCLRRNVEASCHTLHCRLPPSTNFAAYQRLVSSTRHDPYECIAFAAPSLHSTRWSQILAQNRNFCLPHLHSTPPLGGRVPSEYCHAAWYGKTIIVWLPDGEKNFEDTITRFDRMYERDRRTDRQTPHDGTGRACIASRGKNTAYIMYEVN